MKKVGLLVKRGWKPAVGVGGLVVMVLWTAGACRERVAPGTVAYEPGFAMSPDYATLTVSNVVVRGRIDVVGTVVSEEKIHLSARIPAYVRAVHVSAGDHVTAGQVLITLDDREIREKLAAAEAQLKQAQTEFQRARRLLETKATTEQAFDAADTAFRSAKANVEGIKVMQTYATISSPIGGVVTDRRIEVGDLANPGQVLLAVYDPTHMRLDAPVPVRLTDRLTKGATVEVTLERPARTIPGEVTEIVSEIDPATRTRSVRIHLQDAASGVLPGTFGRVWVAGAERRAVLVPAACVYEVGQLELVQVVQDTRVLRRLVKTGERRDGAVEVLSGLSDGDVVLREPVQEM